MNIEYVVRIQMGLINALWGILQSRTAKNSITYTEGERYVKRAKTAEFHALLTPHTEQERWGYARWLGQYATILTHLVQQVTPNEYAPVIDERAIFEANLATDGEDGTRYEDDFLRGWANR